MTGPEHYREAERLIGRLDRISEWVQELTAEQAAASIANVTSRAQVHATLALAAATALETAGVYISADTSASWSTAIGAGEIPHD